MSAKKIRRVAVKEAKKIMPSNREVQQDMEEQIETFPGNTNSFEALFNSDRCENESSSSNSDSEEEDPNICDELAKWTSDFSITFAALNALLFILNKCKIKVPKDGRTILKTPTEVVKRNVGDGVYVHYGIKSALTDYLVVNLTTLQNVYVPQNISSSNILIELRDEVRSLKSLLDTSNKKIDVLTEEVQQNRKTIGKLTEEVIAVKLENRKHHNSIAFKNNPKFDKLPFMLKDDLNAFNSELEKDKEFLDDFKNFIGNIGGDGQTQFLRSSIRKVFSDELASQFSWKGTNEKPSAEKLFITTIVINICHQKYKAEAKEINGILQQHFVHAKERLQKRKRQCKN